MFIKFCDKVSNFQTKVDSKKEISISIWDGSNIRWYCPQSQKCFITPNFPFIRKKQTNKLLLYRYWNWFTVFDYNVPIENHQLNCQMYTYTYFLYLLLLLRNQHYTTCNLKRHCKKNKNKQIVMKMLYC